MKISSNYNLPKCNIRPYSYSRLNNVSIPVSAKNGVSFKANQNKSRTLVSVLAGASALGITALALIKFHKSHLSKEMKQVQKIFKDIFQKDINASETKKLAKKYKQIIGIQDNEEFCRKLFEQLQIDHNAKVNKLTFLENPDNASGSANFAGMITAPDSNSIIINAFNYKNKRDFFSGLFHEFRHVKQAEIMYRTDKKWFKKFMYEKFVSGGKGRGYKQMLNENNGNVPKTVNQVKRIISKNCEIKWGNLEPFAKNSPEYNHGMQLISGQKSYVASGSAYWENIVEVEAHKDGSLAENLFDLLSGIK